MTVEVRRQQGRVMSQKPKEKCVHSEFTVFLKYVVSHVACCKGSMKTKNLI